MKVVAVYVTLEQKFERASRAFSCSAALPSVIRIGMTNTEYVSLAWVPKRVDPQSQAITWKRALAKVQAAHNRQETNLCYSKPLDFHFCMFLTAAKLI